MISLLVSKVVLIVLISETMRLYARLSIANRNLQRERANSLAGAEAAVAAIAHEIRQPLASMSIRAGAGHRFLDRTSPDLTEAKLLFEHIKADAFRASELFESFLTLSREGGQASGLVDMNELALEVIELLHNELGAHNVTTTAKLAPELPLIPGSRGQLREVLLNLMHSAIEAMPTINAPESLASQPSILIPIRFSFHCNTLAPALTPMSCLGFLIGLSPRRQRARDWDWGSVGWLLSGMAANYRQHPTWAGERGSRLRCQPK